MAEDIDLVYRDYVTPGVPNSGEYLPEKARIRNLLKQISDASGQAITRRSREALDAITPPNENYMGIVLNDATPEDNGYYFRSNGLWVKGRSFPDTFARLQVSGGTANAVQAEPVPGVDPATVLVFFIRPTQTNTGAVTLDVGSTGGKPVVNKSGAPLVAGDFTAGRVVLLDFNGTQYGILSDTDVAGLAAAAQTAAGQAATSATNAAASASAAATAVGGVNAATNFLLLEPTRTWLGYLTAQSLAAPPRDVVRRIDEFIELEIAEGIWAEHDVFQLYALNVSGVALVNIKNPGTFGATAVNSPAFTAYKGFKGNGTNSHLTLGYNPAGLTQFQQNDAHAMVAAIVDDGSDIYGSTAGAQNISIAPSGSTLVTRLNNASSSSVSVNALAGVSMINRASSASYIPTFNGIEFSAQVQTSSARHSTTMSLLRNGAAYSDGYVLAHSIGGALTLDQREAHYSFVQALLVDLGAYA